MYSAWRVSVTFLQGELRRMHSHFKHPVQVRLYAITRRAESRRGHRYLFRDREDVTKRCEVCQREAPPPHRFRLVMANGDGVFHEVVCLDIMKINTRSVLYAINCATNPGAAKFLNRENVEEL